jgi:lipopolysaccharide transport system ATP-binding protein
MSSEQPAAISSDVAISVRNVSKKFRLFSSPAERLAEALHPFRKQYHHEFWALKNVSFDVHRGEIVGILGRNGSGKSTLLQIICAVMQATEGEVVTNGRISALLELGAGFNPEFTGRENVFLNGAIMGFSRKQMQARMPEIEAFADVGQFFDQPVKTYSSGMFVRVAFAAAIHIDPEILVVDEALSVGDAKFQHRCFQRIRQFMEAGKTILVVSHSTDTLLRLCHRGIVFDNGRLDFAGPIAGAVNRYQQLMFGTSSKGERLSTDAALAAADDRETGTPGEILTHRLSSDRTDRVADKPGYNAHETRLGVGGAKIIDFDFVVDGRLNPPEIPPSSRVELVVKVAFDQPLNNVSLGFGLVTVDGTYVFGTNLFMMDEELLSAEAGDVVAVVFGFTSHVAGGEYFLNLGCNRFIDGEDIYLDIRRSVAKLKFSQTPGVGGFVNLEVEHRVLEARAALERT